MKGKFLIVLALAAMAVNSYALSVSVAGGKKDINRSKDASGNPLMFNDDKGWKVFANELATAEIQVTDESGVAPKQGILHKICVESGSAAQWALVWDTSAITSAGTASAAAAVVNRKLFPAVFSQTSASYGCTPDINAVFTAGLRTINSDATVRTYIYWRGLGDVR